MEPVISSSKSNKCGDAIGSNCVNYNGDSIPCISLCSTDTVSDVIKKLGQTECYTQSLLDLTNLNLSCVYTPCPSCQQPTKLVDVLQIMVNTICTQASQITTLQGQIATLLAGS